LSTLALTFPANRVTAATITHIFADTTEPSLTVFRRLYPDKGFWSRRFAGTGL
jgi:uncharacterized protein YggT (Ycf19 family)